MQRRACWGVADPGTLFVTHRFLAALEESGSLGPESGWAPLHAVAEEASGRIVAVMPLYLKSHSRGEYVFDDAWAAAFMRAGRPVLPEAPVGGSVHPGVRPADPGRAGTGGMAPRGHLRNAGWRRPHRSRSGRLVGPHFLLHPGGMGPWAGLGDGCAARPCSFIGPTGATNPLRISYPASRPGNESRRAGRGAWPRSPASAS